MASSGRAAVECAGCIGSHFMENLEKIRMAAVRRPQVAASAVLLFSFAMLMLDVTMHTSLKNTWRTSPAGRAVEERCRCLLSSECPLVSWNSSLISAECAVHQFGTVETASCWKRRFTQDLQPTRLILLGDPRLLHLYRYIRDQLAVETERIEGPRFCRQLASNWTLNGHYTVRNASCRFFSVNKWTRLEYVWAGEEHWSEWIQQQQVRCRYGMCPTLVVVSSRLDLMLQDHVSTSWRDRVTSQVERLLPQLEKLKEHGARVWWKLQEQLLVTDERAEYSILNKIIQRQNTVVKRTLQDSGIEVWSSSASIASVHHRHCQGLAGETRYVSADFRCRSGYHIGNSALRQYLNIILNFLCGSLVLQSENACCVLSA